MNRWNPFAHLFISRFREFYREPEAIFWVYGFPILLAVGLGIAFWSREPEPPVVDVQAAAGADSEIAELVARLKTDGLPTEIHDEESCRQRLRIGTSALYVVRLEDGFRYVYDPARAESVLARYRVDQVIERWKAGIHLETEPTSSHSSSEDVAREWRAGKSAWQTIDSRVKEPGNRYIDFLMPGLMGLNLMGGGLWGVGFVIVDMRVRKLLKRLLATPMPRSQFLLSILVARLAFMAPEMLLLFLLGWLGFGVPMHGNFISWLIVVLAGAMAFSGIGLLIASRTAKTETVSGLMNLVMLPMWMLSGTFFSSKRFPDVTQPFIQALPLTQLNDALREIMLEGKSLATVGWRVAILAAWGVICFFLGLRWFRWQ
jgi:ABC-type multidrug transport system permease subunit